METSMDEEIPRTSWLVPSLGALLFCVTFLTLVFNPVGLLADGDTGYHVRAGEYMLRTHTVPKVDIFSYHTPALPWTAHEWLSEIIMALAHGAFGLSGVVVLFSLLLAVTVSLLFRTLRPSGTANLPALGITLGVLCASQLHWLARPHVFSLLFMLGWQHTLNLWQHGDRNRLYLLPPSMLLWVNLHGGFLGGFILLGAFLAGNLFGCWSGEAPERALCRKRVRELLVVTGACLTASLCNPSGYQILFFPFRLVSNRFLMDHVVEFLSPNFHEFLPFKYLLLFMIVLLALSRKALHPVDLVLVLLFTNMALYSVRYIPLFALVSAPILMRHWPEGGASPILRRYAATIGAWNARSSGFFWPAAATVVVAAALATGALQHGFDPAREPVAATEFLLHEKIPGRMFNDDEFGDYLIYRGFPQYRVFLDGRSDMYGSDMVREYCAVNNFEPRWEQILERYRISWLFIGSGSALARYLASRPEWVLIYADPVAKIFLKDLPLHRNLIAKYRRSVPQLATTHPPPSSR